MEIDEYEKVRDVFNRMTGRTAFSWWCDCGLQFGYKDSAIEHFKKTNHGVHEITGRTHPGKGDNISVRVVGNQKSHTLGQ